MFSTTLRIPDELAAYLQEAASAEDLSVNAYLTRLIVEQREAERRRRLALDWAAYGSETAAQDVGYALEAQGEIAAEREVPYGAGPGRGKPGRRK